MEIILNITRELDITWHGKRENGCLRINRLYQREGEDCWRCDWSLDRLYPEAVHFTGDDPLQALNRTLDFAASFIRSSSMEDHISIVWQYDGDHGGLDFPQAAGLLNAGGEHD